MDSTPTARSPRAAAHLAAWPVALLGVALVVPGVLYVRYAEPYGWFGVGCGAVLLVLALVGLLRRDWALALFGALFALALSALLVGIAGKFDVYIVAGVVSLIVVGCGAALIHQLARLADAAARDQEPLP